MCRKVEIYPGAFHLPAYLSLEEQARLVQRCRDIGSSAVGFYTPRVRGGAKMRIQMVCLGQHWNARTYQYEAIRSDYDGLPVQDLPVEFVSLAARIARVVNMKMDPQLCILNHYTATGKLGLHQDKDEDPETLEAGIPIVSVSVGDTAKFLIGGTRRKDQKTMVLLRSGDAFVFGGPSRMRYHGVASILSGTVPDELGMVGRFNLTFRQATLKGSEEVSSR